MKNLFEPATVEALKERIVHLRPESERQWGSMSAAQVAAHCSAALEMATGDLRPSRSMIGRVIGFAIKAKVVGNDEPLRRNTPTAKELVIGRQPDFDAERTRLLALIDRFAAAGPGGCTTHPHTFFGPMAPQEWAVLMYKHLDHHLRQFGV
jgi:Protein of unknown function (DUF1569)